MELVRWNPRREWFGMSNRFNRIFDDFFHPALENAGALSEPKWNPKVDIYEGDENIVLEAELPGMDKKDVSVDLKGRVLTLKGERSLEREIKEDDYHRRERTYGKFERAFSLPPGVDTDQIKADFKDGVLKIEIPKPAEDKPRQITIH